MTMADPAVCAHAWEGHLWERGREYCPRCGSFREYDPFRLFVIGEAYTHDQAIAITDADVEGGPREAIRSAIAAGDLALTNDWKVVRR